MRQLRAAGSTRPRGQAPVAGHRRTIRGRTTVLALGILVTALAPAMPAAAQSPTPSAGPGVVPAVGAVPGTGVGLVLGIVGSGAAGGWESLVGESIVAEATVAAASVVPCGDRLPARPTGACRDLGGEALPDVLIDLRPSAPAGEACPPAGTPLIVVARRDARCGATLVGPDDRDAGALLGAAVGETRLADGRCAVDRLLLLAARDGSAATPDERPPAPDAAADRLAGLRDGFASTCGKAIPDGSAALDGDPAGLPERLRAAFSAIPADGHAVVLAADDHAANEALAAAGAAGRSGSVAIGAIGGLRSAWSAIACDPTWVAEVALQPERHGRAIVPVAIALAGGETVSPFVATPMRLVGAADIRTLYPDVPGC